MNPSFWIAATASLVANARLWHCAPHDAGVWVNDGNQKRATVAGPQLDLAIMKQVRRLITFLLLSALWVTQACAAAAAARLHPGRP